MQNTWNSFVENSASSNRERAVFPLGTTKIQSKLVQSIALHMREYLPHAVIHYRHVA